MFCFRHARAVLLAAALVIAPHLGRISAAQEPTQHSSTSIHLRWGARAGVSRYRLQLALDKSFADIVFDRIVAGNETEVKELAPGRYFWRVAPITTSLGPFSSAAVIEVREQSTPAGQRPTRPIVNQVAANPVSAGGGWRAALGDVNQTALARLRSPDNLDVVATNSEGVVFALDAASGVALWSLRTSSQRTPRAGSFFNTILVVPTRSRRDNVVILSGTVAIEVEGSTGRELWRSTLPAAASSGAVITDRTGSRLIIVDNSRQRLFVLSDVDGNLVSQINLPVRAIGAPMAIDDQGSFAIAYETGTLEIRDFNGAVIRSGNALSAATTAPLFVRGRRGDLILLGTKDGLTAMAADDLRPLGRVSIKDDAPRGTLAAQDLDGDGVPEVIMSTKRRHIIAVNASDGKVIWDVAGDSYGDAFAFADINRDHIIDVFVSGVQRFAVALSGRDATVIWKDNEPSALATNHVSAFESRTLIAAPYGSGILLIAADPGRTGLRAIAFASSEIRPTPR
jgi:outer membrane protein assembly factor BamB